MFPQSNYTGDINYGTHLTPTQLRTFLDAGVKLQWNWAQLLASPYSYPTEYHYAGLSVGSGGGFAFGKAAPDAELSKAAFSAYSGGGGITQLENLKSLAGPPGFGALWWHCEVPEVLPRYLFEPHPLDPEPIVVGEMVDWVGGRPGLDADFRVFPPLSCWEAVASEFSAFAGCLPKGAQAVALPPEMSLF